MEENLLIFTSFLKIENILKKIGRMLYGKESFQIKFEDVGTATFKTIGNVIDYIEGKMQ